MLTRSSMLVPWRLKLGLLLVAPTWQRRMTTPMKSTGARSAGFDEAEWLYQQGVFDGFSSEEFEGLDGQPVWAEPAVDPAAVRAANAAMLRGNMCWGLAGGLSGESLSFADEELHGRIA